MLTLINTNRMAPLVAPIGLDYVAGAVRTDGLAVEVLDLALCEDPDARLREHFWRHSPELVGLTLRNTDDCFWPSAQWFVPALARTVSTIRTLTGAPIVLGGVGFSIFAERVVAATGVDFGIRGDGEQALVALLRELRGARRFETVPGLVWRADDGLRANRPSWPAPLSLATARDNVDNATYFVRGGQGSIETKRGCNRHCIYCADPLAKGPTVRTRPTTEVADEVESLLAQGVDVLHLCDCEFNIPREHALAVCQEFVRRNLGARVRWYAYLAVTPFDRELAGAARRAGCVGINFTGDSASAAMLRAYGQPHRRADLARTVAACRDNDIAVMIDLLLAGPGETPQIVAETIDFIKRIGPDCAGAALGVRIYPGTEMARTVAAQGPLEPNPGIRRRYDGPVDFFQPTFYVSPELGPRPAELVRGLIAGDPRFFPPADPEDYAPDRRAPGDYNYNDNAPLVTAIAAGARGAYWDILRRLNHHP